MSMKTSCRRRWIVQAWVWASLLLGAGSASGQTQGSGGSYSIDHYSIDNGSASMSAESFVVVGSVGQPDAEPLQPAGAGNFQLVGGFWAGVSQATAPADLLFYSGFE